MFRNNLSSDSLHTCPLIHCWRESALHLSVSSQCYLAFVFYYYHSNISLFSIILPSLLGTCTLSLPPLIPRMDCAVYILVKFLSRNQSSLSFCVLANPQAILGAYGEWLSACFSVKYARHRVDSSAAVHAGWLKTRLLKKQNKTKTNPIRLQMHSAWPCLSPSTNTSPFENTEWVNETTAGTRIVREKKVSQERICSRLHKQKTIVLHLTLDLKNDINAEPLNRWHHNFFSFNRPVSMESQGEPVSKEDLICRWSRFPLCC